MAVATSSDPHEDKGFILYQEAEKKVKSASSFLGGLFGGGSKLEEAAELYTKSANSYKLVKKYSAAGNSYQKAAEIQEKLGVKHEVATSMVEAGNMYKKSEASRATDCYQQAVEIYIEMGRFSIAAKHLMTLGEVYESAEANIEQAIATYEQAADLYKGEDSVSGANKAMLKVAHMCALLQKFDKSIQLFEEVGMASMENRLLQYGAKEYFFKAVVCHFCTDADKARSAMEKYIEMFPAFEGTREQRLLVKLLDAYGEEDEELFTKEIQEYDTISKIEPWLTTHLLHIKKAMTAQEVPN
ncbi:beta-soluble NSF attachment protein-like [Dysidea avara]|uniref:beta-soluble NSF attachment protein-like n=1 Tax=Dysidea avara TaxID=196820 RepID=UPI00332AAF7E